jgi:pimeloyl-ACP methyl ester carboxylesterase
LVHGFPLDHAMWMGQQQALAGSCRVLTPDLRGFGQSSPLPPTFTMSQFADDLARLLDRLQIDSPVILGGLSMGGYVALQFWQHHRARIAGLILCDTRAAADTSEAAAGRRQLAERVLQQGVSRAVEDMLPRLLDPATAETQAALVADIRRMMQQTPAASFATAQRGMASRPDFSARLADIDVPTLVICGQADAITPPVEMQSIAAAIPGALFEQIPGAGHLAPLEQPQAVNAAIQRFLQRQPPQSGS